MAALASAPVDLVLRGGHVLTLDHAGSLATAIAVRDERIAAVGGDRDMQPLIGPATRIVELAGRTVMPGLIDGHAHLDREGLKSLLPSLAGCASIGEVVERLRAIAQKAPAGHWIVTMPLGEPPEYRWSESMFEEGRLPDRHDLDRVSAQHPVLIRCAWGYWPGQVPTVSIANSAALTVAGVGRHTKSPSPRLRIELDPHGEPTGRFFEDSFQPLAEFTLFRGAPHFTADDRARTMVHSMRAYNAAGTTGIFEGHGVAEEVISAYQRVRAAGRQSIRARLVVSAGWSGASDRDVSGWVAEQSARLRGRGKGDDWLRVAGLFAEVENESEEARLRARCAPQTGWAGFHYDAGLPLPALKTLLHAAAREKLQVCGIQTGMANLFNEIATTTPIAGLRWIVAHPATFDRVQIEGLRDNGIGVTALTGAYVWRRASAVLARIGAEHEETICPLRSLLDAGVPVSLASDNVPVSLWPCVWHAVDRLDRETGRVVAAGQRIGREEALRCASTHGAWLSFDEEERGTLEPGKLADLIVLNEDPMTIPAERLAALAPAMTVVGGRTVWPCES